MALKIIGAIFLVIIIAIGIAVVRTLNYHKKLKAEPVKDIDFSKVKDGEYEGKFDASLWTNNVQVVVANHKITKITLLKANNTPMADKENEIISKIISQQNLKVDVVAGATITTKTILKSTEIALEKGLN